MLLNNKALIILDRDGVINQESEVYVKSPDEWHAIPGSLEAIAELNKAGFRVAVATNQPGIGRGFFTEMILNCIHQKMIDQLKLVNGKIDKIFVCPHHPNEKCDCRKPQPGLLLQAVKYFKVDIKSTYMVGDRVKDIIAARKAQAKYHGHFAAYNAP